jgi:plastocyanin
MEEVMPMRKTLIAAIAAILLLSATGVVLAKTYTVRAVAGEKWRKVHTYIGKGDRVNWKNVDDELHDLTAYGGGWKVSEQLQPGDAFKKRFRKKGTFRYRCAIHSGIVAGACQGMCGFVHVL